MKRQRVKELPVGRCDLAGKLQFRSASAARRKARDLRGGGTQRLWPYLCSHCGLWHLTSRP